MSILGEQLAALATMSPAQLRAEWRRVFRSSPPRFTPDLLRRGIAYRLQERAQGGLPAGTARQLDRLSRSLARGERLEPRYENRLKAGTRLVRRWQDRTYSVLVTDDGFILDDRSFTSLSQVAEAITGVHWSGPRFFGVRPVVTTSGAAAASAVRRVAAAQAAAS